MMIFVRKGLSQIDSLFCSCKYDVNEPLMYGVIYDAAKQRW